MSYNILKSKVNFVGDDTPEIEGMVDTSSDQTISGSKDFETISGSSATFLNEISAQSASFAGTVVLNNDVTVAAGKRIYLDGTGDSANQGPFLYGSISGMYIDGDDAMFLYHDTRMTIFQGTTRVIHLETGSVGIEQPIIASSLSASSYISASSFVGDGSQLSNLGQAGSVLASNIVGNIDGSQISASTGLTTDGNNLAVDLKSQGALADDSGLKVDIGNSPNQGSFNNSHYILVSGSTIGNRNLQLSVLESNLGLTATQISSGQLVNARMPDNISVSQLSASTTISGAYFEGDGSGLTGVTGNPTPGGANTEIQFNDDDSLTGSPDLTFFTGSQTLATTNISASSNISGSSLYLQEEIIVGGQTFLDIQGDVVGNNASFVEITASSTIHGYGDIYAENFRGNGNTLNNVPLGTYANSNIVFCDNTADTITSNGSLRWTGTQLVTLGVSASVNISGSGLYFDDSLNLGGQPVINANGDTNFGQLTFFVASSGSTNFPTDNSRATFYVDEAANKFFVFVKYSDGTEKSGSIDLE